MKSKNIILLLITFFLISCSSPEKPKEDIKVKEILNTSTSWDGEPINYPEGKTHIISRIVELTQNSVIDFHCHPIPTFAYILEGVVEVSTKEGLNKEFSKGEAFAEVVNTWHKGKAIDGPLKILVFYAGSDKFPDTIKHNINDPNQRCIRYER